MKATSKRRSDNDTRGSRDSESHSYTGESRFFASRHSKSRRTATLYDAVAGRVGLNGFLKPEQIWTSQTQPSAPEEVLLRRVNAPDRIAYDYYNADERLNATQRLPDSDLLKNIHTYVADYYQLANDDDHQIDFQSFDETALLAMGILLEEACKEVLGESGDMVFSEPARRDLEAPQNRLSQYQIVGKVVPKQIEEYQSLSDEDLVEQASRPRKRQRRWYLDADDH